MTGGPYPDTPVGPAACNAEGEYWRTQGATSWACNLNDPDANVYNLWRDASHARRRGIVGGAPALWCMVGVR